MKKQEPPPTGKKWELKFSGTVFQTLTLCSDLSPASPGSGHPVVKGSHMNARGFSVKDTRSQGVNTLTSSRIYYTLARVVRGNSSCLLEECCKVFPVWQCQQQLGISCPCFRFWGWSWNTHAQANKQKPPKPAMLGSYKIFYVTPHFLLENCLPVHILNFSQRFDSPSQ